MRVMVMVKATADSEAGVMPGEQLLADMGRFNEELVNAGVMLAGEGLHPSSRGVRVRFSGRERSVIDGPFAETREQLGGYYLVECRDLDEAIGWAARIPGAKISKTEWWFRPSDRMVLQVSFISSGDQKVPVGEPVGTVPPVTGWVTKKDEDGQDTTIEYRLKGKSGRCVVVSEADLPGPRASV